MNKINSLKSILGSRALLSNIEITLIKGGAVTNPVALANASTTGINASTAAADDKRRSRPGGGVSTL
jgi:hypothetical protein